MRIQTPLLVLVVVGICLSFFFPLWERKAEAETAGYTYVRVLTILSYTTYKHPSANAQQKEAVYRRPVEYIGIPYIGLLCALSIAAATATLLLYRQRLAQLKLCRIHFWVLAAIMLACFHYVTGVEKELPSNSPGTYTWGAYGIVGALLLNWIASLLIRRDERLVRDADSLR